MKMIKRPRHTTAISPEAQQTELPHNYSSFEGVVASKLESSRTFSVGGRFKWGYQ